MLLRWVLTRDSDAVLSMLARWLIEGDDVTQIRPETWDDVLRTYCVDDSLPKGDATRLAVFRAERFLYPAQNEIYGFLRRGKIDGLARRNGSGEKVIIESFLWAGLRFHSLDGHDIAVPVDGEREPLPLPHPLTDYLSGSVSTTTTPTVWPDPEFPVEQAMILWPPLPAGTCLTGFGSTEGGLIEGVQGGPQSATLRPVPERERADTAVVRTAEPQPAGAISKKRRRDEKRPDIEKAVRELWIKEGRLELPKRRWKALCGAVDQYLEWPRGTCNERTLRRAIEDIEAVNR
jgi:hypothetical protein